MVRDCIWKFCWMQRMETYLCSGGRRRRRWRGGCFILFPGVDEGHGLLLGFFLFLICRGNWGDSDVKLVFSGFLCLRFLCFLCVFSFSVLLGFFPLSCWVSSLCLALFSLRVRSPLLSLYRASGSLGGGNGCPLP